MYTKTEAFDQHLFLSKSEAAIHYGSITTVRGPYDETQYNQYFGLVNGLAGKA